MSWKTLDRNDIALLAAFLLIAGLGIWTNCLLFNDGAVLLSVGWLGDAWDLYFNQIAGRAVSTFATFGPAWAIRRAFDLSPGAYMVLAHTLYFAVPLGVWLVIRAVEPMRAFSRLYLATTLVLINFPSELIVGIGLWTIWVALLADPARSIRQTTVATLGLGLAMAFTHPSTAAMSLIFLIIGLVRTRFGRPFPRGVIVAAATMTALLLAAYALTSTFLPPTNPSIVDALGIGRYDYVDLAWMVVTLFIFPMLPALWLLQLAPGNRGGEPALARSVVGNHNRGSARSLVCRQRHKPAHAHRRSHIRGLCPGFGRGPGIRHAAVCLVRARTPAPDVVRGNYRGRCGLLQY